MTSVQISTILIPKTKLKTKFIGRITLLVLFAYLFFIIESIINWKGDIVVMDGITKITYTILISEIIVIIISIISLYIIIEILEISEINMLILTNIIGFIYMITSNDLLITLLSWELFNLSLYLLIGTYGNKIESSLSATIKYFLLSAITTGFLLLSIALIYIQTGSTHYDHIY